MLILRCYWLNLLTIIDHHHWIIDIFRPTLHINHHHRVINIFRPINNTLLLLFLSLMFLSLHYLPIFIPLLLIYHFMNLPHLTLRLHHQRYPTLYFNLITSTIMIMIITLIHFLLRDEQITVDVIIWLCIWHLN